MLCDASDIEAQISLPYSYMLGYRLEGRCYSCGKGTNSRGY